MPVVPQPAPVAAGGFGPVNFVLDYLSIACDIDVLRQLAMGEDRDGNRVVRNARLFESAARLKTQLLNTAVSVRNDAVESERLQQLLVALMGRLSQRDPAFVNAVMADLDDLDRDMGITMDGLLNRRRPPGRIRQEVTSSRRRSGRRIR